MYGSPTSHQIATINQVIENLLTQYQGRINPQILNSLYEHYRTGKLPVAQLISQRLPGWTGSNSVDQNTLFTVVRDALNEWAAHLQNQMQMMAHQGYNNPHQGFNWGMGGYSGGVNVESSGLGGGSPVVSMEPKMPQFSNPVFSPPPVERSEEVAMQTEPVNQDLYEFNKLMEKPRDKYWYNYSGRLRDEKVISGESEGNIKRYLIVADAKDPVNNYYELLCELWPSVSGSPPQGEFIIFIDYERMIHLPIGRTSFLTLVSNLASEVIQPGKEIEAGYLLKLLHERLSDMSSRIKISVESMLVREINNVFSRVIRRSSNLSFNIKLDDLEDLIDLINMPRKYLNDENIKLCMFHVESITIQAIMNLLRYAKSVEGKSFKKKEVGSLGYYLRYYDNFSFYDFQFPSELNCFGIMDNDDAFKSEMWEKASKENVIITTSERIIIQNVLRNPVPYYDIDFNNHFGSCNNAEVARIINNKDIIHRMIVMDESRHINSCKQFYNVIFPRDTSSYGYLEPIKDETPGILDYTRSK